MTTDQALIAEFLEGSAAAKERAFARLYDRHYPAVTRLLRRVLRRTEDVEDVLQVTFVEVYKGAQKYDASREFLPWVQGIAMRQAANHLRRARRWAWFRMTPPEELPLPSADSAGSRSSEEQVIQRQLLGMLYQAMEKLPPKKRIAFSLYAFEGMGFTEIGQLIDASPQTVRARVLSAKEIILKSMDRASGRAAVEGLITRQPG